MISYNDQKHLKIIENQWMDFKKTYRGKMGRSNLSQNADPEKGWLTMLEREEMIDDLIRILKQCKVEEKVIRKRVVYE